MDETKAWYIIKWLGSIESELCRFLQYVPFHEQNKRVWSPKLAIVMGEACALIDSVFRSMSPGIVEIKGRRRTRKSLTIDDYRFLFSDQLRLTTRKVVALVWPPFYVTPFAGWNSPVPGQQPCLPWWAVHNDLKHSRADDFTKATLENAIDALAAALILIGLIKEFTRPIIAEGWVEHPQLRLQQLSLSNSLDATVDTQLFSFYIGERELPENLSELQVTFYGQSKRLAAVLSSRY